MVITRIIFVPSIFVPLFFPCLDTVEERRRAARLCSAFYQHRILLRHDFPLHDCLLKLNECGQVNTSFLDDVDDCLRKHQTKMAADLFRGSISDLPDSVVLTLVDEVLPKIASAKDLYQAMLECPGRVLCTVSPRDGHSTTGRWLSCIDTCAGVVCACVSE